MAAHKGLGDGVVRPSAKCAAETAPSTSGPIVRITDWSAAFMEHSSGMAYARRVFPGYVLEREGTREDCGEPRFRVIGEVLRGTLVVVYTPPGSTCRLVTAWEAEDWELDLWYERFS